MSASGSDPNRSSKQIENIQHICYLSAAPQINLKALVDVLEEKNMTPVLTSALHSTATTLLEENIRAISQADLFIALLSSTEENAHVYFELGIAIASKVRTLLITPLEIRLPPNIAQVPLICTDPQNKGALAFAIEQALSSRTPTISRSDLSFRSKQQPIGDFADKLLERLDELGDKIQEIEVVDLVKLALQESGISIITQSPIPMVEPRQAVRADLALWSDALSPWIGNPLLIEVKVFRQKQIAISDIVEHVLAYLRPDTTRSALILYIGEPSLQSLSPRMYPYIFYMEVRQLFTQLRMKSFAQILIDMRNRRVHGVEV
jgi:hypothetical protein